MTSLLDKIKKNSTIKESAILAQSKFFNKKDMVVTSIPAINIALSARLDGGLTPGLTMWAGPSKHFKTLFSLILAKAYMDKYPDAVMLFYDSEFGTPVTYFESLNIDTSRVIHSPLLNIEQLKFDIMNQLHEIERGDKVIIIIDSIGNLASKKEVDDAIAGNSAADMTRAKQIKSLFRMVTPHLNIKDIPMVVVNHTYMTLEMFSKPVVGGGTGSYYSADNIYIIGRQQDKPTSGANKGKLVGYEFIINVEKSRYVKEKSKIPISVTFEGGINRYSGLLDLALEANMIAEGKVGRGTGYAKVDEETGEIMSEYWPEDKTNNMSFWDSVLRSKKFQAFIEQKYALSANDILNTEDEDEVAEIYEGLEEEGE